MYISYSEQIEKRLEVPDSYSGVKLQVTLINDAKVIMRYDGSARLEVDMVESDQDILVLASESYYQNYRSLDRNPWFKFLSQSYYLGRILWSIEAKRYDKVMPDIHRHCAAVVYPRGMGDDFQIGDRLAFVPRINGRGYISVTLDMAIRSIEWIK